jgi:hypothetical protein
VRVPLPPYDVTGPVLAEVFVVTLAGGIVLSGPCGPAAWHIEVASGDDPMPVTREVVRRVLGEPVLLHSTSWRRDKGGVMLTFLAVVRPEQVAAYRAAPVPRAELARGAPAAAPEDIGHGQVLEHALRHLAWLVKDDPVVAAALDEQWRAELDGYTPEPFRVVP